MIDGTIVKVHRHGKDEKGGLRAKPSAAQRGGVTSKIVALIKGKVFDANWIAETSACVITLG